MSASDPDQILKYGPMGHDNALVRAKFGEFRGILYSPVGVFAEACWGQPYPSTAPYGTAYATYEELFARFAITKGVDDDGFDWSIFPDSRESYLDAADFQKSALLLRLDEYGTSDSIAYFPSWDKKSLNKRDYQLPIDVEEPAVLGLNTVEKDPIAGSRHFEFIDETVDGTVEEHALLSYHQTALSVKNQTTLTARGFFGGEIVGGYVKFSPVTINFATSADFKNSVDEELKTRFNPVSSGIFTARVPLDSEGSSFRVLHNYDSINAYNLGVPIFRESLDGPPQQDHSDSNLLRPTAFGVKRIDTDDGPRDWIIYTYFRVFTFLQKVRGEDNRYIYVATDPYVLQEKIFAIECTILNGKIDLIYPKNVLELIEMQYTDTFLKSKGGDPIEFFADTFYANPRLQNSSIWAFNKDCTKMSAFRTYYEYKKTIEVDGVIRTVKESYIENDQLIEIDIKSSDGEPIISISNLTKTPSATHEYELKRNVDFVTEVTTQCAGDYNADNEFITLDSYLKLTHFESTPGKVTPLRTEFEIELSLNKKSIFKGTRQLSTSVFDESPGFRNTIVFDLATIAAVDFNTESCIYTQYTCTVRGDSEYTKELVGAYEVKEFLKDEASETLLWSDSTTDVSKIGVALGNSWFDKLFTLEVPPVVGQPYIEPFATILKSLDATSSGITIFNYSWITPFHLDLGFYTDPVNLIERLAPKASTENPEEILSLGSLRRLT